MVLAGVGETTYEFVPSRINAPCFIISAGSPYISQGQTFTDFTLRFEVLALSGVATNEVETDKLDALLTNAIDALDTWFVDEVEQPQQFEINGVAYLGARINISTDKTLS